MRPADPFCRCRELGRTCWFEKRANEVAKRAKNGQISPEQALREIATLRISAREINCPHVNEIDPYYPGKERL